MPRGTAYPVFTGYAVAAQWEHLEPSRAGLRRRAALLLRPLHAGDAWRCVLAPGDEPHGSFEERDFEEAGPDALLRGLAFALTKLKSAARVIAAADAERQGLRKSIDLSSIELEGFSDQTSTYALTLADYLHRYGQHAGAVERL